MVPETRSSKHTSSGSVQAYDSRRGDAAFRLEKFDGDDLLKPGRVNYFTILWVQEGSGKLQLDCHEYEFRAPALIFSNPYQIVFVSDAEGMKGVRLDFHANFFCIETYHEEVGCNGVLFNDIYGAPVLPAEPERARDFDKLIGQMQEELASAALAQSEILLSYLKVFLIKATRMKMEQQRFPGVATTVKPEVLGQLVELIEIHFKEKHRPSDYAQMLGISEKALNKIVRTHFSKTLTSLIRDRILKHAKWHLLHTRKPVKEVAGELGFGDEFYFSRLFKRVTGMAPSGFRDFETAIRGGRNLSM